jgi:hypothetical protein
MLSVAAKESSLRCLAAFRRFGAPFLGRRGYAAGVRSRAAKREHHLMARPLLSRQQGVGKRFLYSSIR